MAEGVWIAKLPKHHENRERGKGARVFFRGFRDGTSYTRCFAIKDGAASNY